MTHDVLELAEVVGYLMAITVLARAAAGLGLFEAWGGAVARSARDRPERFVLLAAALAAAVTVALTLDATVVLLTPVLLAAGAGRLGALLTLRLANSGSLLLPVSNLTNLLAFTASGLTFGRFTLLMLPVWVVAVVVEVALVRWWTRRTEPLPRPVRTSAPPVPRLAALVVLLVLVGVAAGLTPWVVGAVGAVAVGAEALVRRRVDWRDLVEAANVPFAAVVLAWGAVVLAVGTTSVGRHVSDLVPNGSGWFAIVGTALLGMVAANLVNNLPATLLLLPAAAAVGPVAVLALLVGVNVGANLTAIGSLANLLWRRAGAATVVGWGEVHRLGALTTPALVVVCATVLWAWSRLV